MDSGKEAQSSIIQDIKRVAHTLGYTPSYSEYFARSNHSERQVRTLFGAYSVAVQAAGLELKSKKTMKLSNEELFGKCLEKALAEYHKSEDFEVKERAVRVNPTLYIPDTHFPFVCQRSLNEMHYFIRQHKKRIENVVQLGDLYDLYSATKFAKSLNVYTPFQEMRIGFEMAQEMWRKIRETLPDASLYQILGNHDVRPLKRVIENAPEVEHLVSIDKWFAFDGIETHRNTREELEINGALITHGTYTKIGDHARFYRMSVVHGHTHRGGVHFVPCKKTGEMLFELDCGYLGDPASKALSYTPSRYNHWTRGWGYRDEWGPRFIPSGQDDSFNGSAFTPDMID